MKKKMRKQRLIEGLPVVDAKVDLLLEISPKDVKSSKKSDPSNCAAAIACRRVYKKEVRVFITKTYIKEKNHWVRYQTPERISREIISFDRGSGFVPGVYKINTPSRGNRLGNYKKTGPKKRTGETNQPHHMTKNVRSFRDQGK